MIPMRDMGDRPPIDITTVECPHCGDTGTDPTDDNPNQPCTCPMGRIVARRRERETT